MTRPLPRPSNAYSSSLEPRPRDRLIVLGSSVGLAALGLLPIATLPGPLPVRFVLGFAWLLVNAREFAGILAGYRQASGFRLDASLTLDVRTASGDWRAARIVPGTTVAGPFVWLRYCDNSGRPRGELLTGSPRADPGFRRLVVLLELGREAA